MDARSNDSPLQLEYDGSVPARYGPAAGARPALGIVDILDVLRRGWRLPLTGCLIGLMVGLGYIVTVKTPYKSSARLLIDRSMNRYLQTNKLIDQPTLDDTEVGSQIYVLSSDSVVVPVVRTLNLAHDGEFAPQTLAGIQFVGASNAAETDEKLERITVEAVLKRLTVLREDVANVISVTFESQSPTKAAEIANAIADTYIANTMEAKLNSTKIVSQWLQERLIELKRQASDADRVLQEFRKANNLIYDGMGTQNPELLANLKTQLANARIAVAEAKERLERIKGATGEEITTRMSVDALVNTGRSAAINFAFNNSDLAKLRAQVRDLEARATEVESRVGPTHSASVKLREQIEGLRSSIRAEEKRISDAYSNEYRIAKARENELAASALQLSGGTETTSQVRELESTTETLHNLYNGFLLKYKEITASQTDTLPVQTAHIISRAMPPLYKSSKKAIAIFAGSIMFGLFFGAGAAVGREWFSDVLRTRSAVEQATHTKCVMLPMVAPGSAPIAEHALVAPHSRFTGALREIKTLIDAGADGDGGKVIAVVSSLPQEGKTVVAANLAALITASTGARTLVIDGDLHLRKLTTALLPDARQGLMEALEEPSRLAGLVTKRLRSGADFLPCVTASRIPNAAELLGSPRMERLLTVAGQSYGYIIIEIAPIMSVVDVKLVERFVDGFIFVLEWGRTKRTVVLDALSYADVIRDRLSAIVLNKVDPGSLRTVENYEGVKSGDYYQD